ncbi:MAG: Cytosol aminopeptidase [Myxococcaceae bacterium]|nr:Cytosol aminopeptidase [Myxococcaceae bacterium]
MTTAQEPSLEALDSLLGCDALCLFVAEDDRPLSGAAGFVDWRLGGGLSRVLEQGFFIGEVDDRLLFPTGGSLPVPRIFAVGVGREASLDAARLGNLLEGAAAMLKKAGVGSVALALPRGGGLGDEARVEALKRHFLPGFGSGAVTVLAERGVRALLGGTR